MSQWNVDEIRSFAGTDAPLTVTKAIGTNDTHMATTAFVRGELTSDYASDTLDVGGDWTFSGDPTFTGEVDLSGATVTVAEPSLSIVGRCGYSSIPTGTYPLSISASFTKALAFTISKTEVGSCDITIPSTMADTDYQVLVSLNTNAVNWEIKNQTNTSFTITTEDEAGDNADVSDIRFTLIGELA